MTEDTDTVELEYSPEDIAAHVERRFEAGAVEVEIELDNGVTYEITDPEDVYPHPDEEAGTFWINFTTGEKAYAPGSVERIEATEWYDVEDQIEDAAQHSIDYCHDENLRVSDDRNTPVTYDFTVQIPRVTDMGEFEAALPGCVEVHSLGVRTEEKGGDFKGTVSGLVVVHLEVTR